MGLPMNMDKRISTTDTSLKKSSDSRSQQKTRVRATLGTLDTVGKVNKLFFQSPFPPPISPAKLASSSSKSEKADSNPMILPGNEKLPTLTFANEDAKDGVPLTPSCKLKDIKEAFASMLTPYNLLQCKSVLSIPAEQLKQIQADMSNEDFKKQKLMNEYINDYTYPFSPPDSRSATLAKHILNAQEPDCVCLSEIPAISNEASQIMDCSRAKNDPVDKLIQTWNVCNGRTSTGYEVPEVNPLIHPFDSYDARTYSKSVIQTPTSLATMARGG